MTIKKMVYKRINRQETFTGLATNVGGDDIYFTMIENRIVCYNKEGMILRSPEVEREIGKLNLIKAS